jgi:EAL domain-containing protein (putative c-di-GMP-specific phosphodiesterase class I)
VTARGRAPEEVLRNADTAMYRAKADGRGRIDFFDESLHATAQLRLDLEGELRHALTDGQLRLHYQPVRAAADLRLVAVEAVLRWEHPVRGVLPPDAFLTAADDAGLLGTLGDEVVVQALGDLARCGDPDLGMCLDVSVLQLREAGGSDVAALVRSTCASLGLEPGRVTLELAQVAAVEAGTDGGAALQRLREVGVRLALDDFGAGPVGPSQLEHLAVDAVTVDPSLVHAAAHSPAGARRLAALVALVHAYDRLAVAEGVEDGAQLEAVRACGSRPVAGRPPRCAGPVAVAVLTPSGTAAGRLSV